MSTDRFYSTLPVLGHFLDVANSEKFTEVPSDWYVLITDIVNSTIAIDSGRYREVNLLGAASIAVVLNVAQELEVPFVFGGDGSTLLIPPSLFQRSQQALLALQQLAQTRYDLNLRVGIVPVADIIAANYEIKVAKLKISENYSQAMFTGGGLTYATYLLKNSSEHNLYLLQSQASNTEANLSGLECRWQDIFSPREQIVSLIVVATVSSGRSSDEIYRSVIEEIFTIYGTEQSFHPIINDRLNLSFAPEKLKAEIRLRAKASTQWQQRMYSFKVYLENLLGLMFIKAKLRLSGNDWGRYKQDVIAASDYKKFDDVLRMIIASTCQQTDRLIHYLEGRSRIGELVYGVHISDRALMTCLVFERNGRQVHFIDGADGGYTLAAKDLKEKMHQKALNWRSFIKVAKLRNKYEL